MIVYSTDLPKITDTILFNILTPGADSCFTSNPYKVDKIVIFAIEKNFISNKEQEIQKFTVAQDKLQKVEETQKIACDNPTPENILNAQVAKQEAAESANRDTIFFNEAKVVQVVGSSQFPAWLSTDIPNAFIENIPLDEEGNPQFGHFLYTWRPIGIREGDYVICWTWTPNPAGDILQAHEFFTVSSDIQETTVIPTHRTISDKYSTLLERYLPEMFKLTLIEGDLTPQTLERLNGAIADGFTVLEDLSNQLVDLQDANSLHESLLVYLANLFNLKLRSGDPTLWRRQIKNAVPLFKKKGTLGGLAEALEEAGMHLKKLTNLWQVVSPYTWQDAFIVEEDQTIFTLSKTALALDLDNFGLFLLPADEEEFISLPPEYIDFSTISNVTTVTWLGETLSVPIILGEGDILRVLYKFAPVPNQSIENYIRSLDLADQREPRIKYPFKNWNIKVIEEDDPLFDIIIPEKQPFHEPIVFGRIRTEFPYSENVYNMEEYNGSKRCSTSPCDIDKEFLDTCGSCLSSKFTVDIDIENLSNDRIFEAQEIINEYKPFHAVVHSLIFSGEFNDYVQINDTNIKMLMTFRYQENVISGQNNILFNRVIRGGLNVNAILRTVLAESEEIITNSAGNAFNTKIILFCPNVNFQEIGLGVSNVLEILAPHTHAGTYYVSNPEGSIVDIIGITEPLDQNAFTFRLSNRILNLLSTIVTQDDIFNFSDPDANFALLGVVGQDTGPAWQLEVTIGLTTTTHTILSVLPDGTLILDDPGDDLPVVLTTGIEYTLKNDLLVEIASSDDGILKVSRRGRINKNEPAITDIRNYVAIGDFIDISGVQYQVSGLVDTNEFYISGYVGGDAAGVQITIYSRKLDGEVGYLNYNGINLDTVINLESALSIVNGQNPISPVTEESQFKETLLIKIGEEIYKIEQINNSFITLGGVHQDWTIAGTGVVYSVFRFTKNSITINGHEFALLDRRGQEEFSFDIDSTPPLAAALVDAASSSGDFVEHESSVSYRIEYKGGITEEEKVIEPPKRYTFRVR